MNEIPNQEVLAKMWAMVLPYIGGAWEMLQQVWNESPTPVLIGIIVGILLARVARGILIVGAIAVCAIVAVRLFGLNIPGLPG